MKRFVTIALALVLLFSLVSFTGCEQTFTSTVKVTFRVPKGEYAKMNANEISAAINDGAKESEVYEDLFGPYEITIEGTDSNTTTALQAAEESLTKFEIDYELSGDETYVASVTFDGTSYTQEDSVDATTGYYSYWECTINGKLSNSGRQSVTEVFDGDVIVYTWTSSSKPRQDTEAVTEYDANADTTGDIPTDETTIAEESDEVA